MCTEIMGKVWVKKHLEIQSQIKFALDTFTTTKVLSFEL